MPIENPFPLGISVKQDSWEKLIALLNIPDDLKLTAAELNKIVVALDYLYQESGIGDLDADDIDETDTRKWLTPPTVKTGTTIQLSNPIGNNYNYAAASSATSYTLENAVENGQAAVLIDAASEPSFTPPSGYTVRKSTRSEDFAADTEMEVFFRVTGTVVNYYFITY